MAWAASVLPDGWFASGVSRGALAFVLLILYMRALAGASISDPAMPTSSEPYRDDEGWYASDWRADPENPAHALGTAGYRLGLVGGPLADRTARLRDDRFRLWVVCAADGSYAVTGAIAPPAALPRGARLLGSYGFSHGDEAMVWTPVAP